MEFHNENITKETVIKTNGVFVFGSNTEGKHGKGAALFAKTQLGAKDGIASGWTSKNSFAIITKDLTLFKEGYRPYGLLRSGLIDLIYAAKLNKNKTFWVTPLGTNLAKMNVNKIKFIIQDLDNLLGFPSNVKLPIEFAPSEILK